MLFAPNDDGNTDDAPPLDDDSHATDGRKWTSIECDQGRTDVAFSRRFLAAFGDDVLWVPEWGHWLAWDGTRWQRDTGGCDITRFAEFVSDSIWHEASEVRSKDAIKYANDMSRPRTWPTALKVAAAQRAVEVADLNPNRWLLNTPSGTVDLQNGELRSHRREDLITTCTATPYDADAPADQWNHFIASVFPDVAIAAYVQRLFGYAACGRAGRAEELLPVFHGSGSNGKSVLIEMIRRTLGSEFAGPGTHGQLTEKANDRHLTELAALYGKRLVFCAETGQGAALDEDLVKALTGGDEITARFCHRDTFTFAPSFTLFLVTNHRPRIRGIDDGIWRRVNLIPFTQRFWLPWRGETGPEELRADPAIREKLDAERPGILRWIVEGAVEWLAHGLAAPEAVRIATNEYRTSEDVIGRFIEARCFRHPDATVRFKDIHEQLAAWCDDTGENAPNRKRLGMYLTEAGFDRFESSGTRYRGLGIAADNPL